MQRDLYMARLVANTANGNARRAHLMVRVRLGIDYDHDRLDALDRRT